MKKVAVAAFALLAIFLASVLMPCALTAPDSSAPVLGAASDTEVDPNFLPDGKGGVKGAAMMRNSPITEYTLEFVDIDSAQSESIRFDIVDDEGKYSVKLDPGRYNVSAITTKEKVTLSKPIEIVGKQWLEDVDFQFVRSYSFHGNVSYEGMKLSGVNVSLTPVGGTSKNVTQTDEDGHYQFENLTGGVYEILFQKSGFAEERQIVDITVQSYLIIPMERTGLPGINGFILEYDFQHSMMVIGLIGMIVMIAISLGVRYYLTRNPNMMLNEEAEGKSED